MRNELRAWTIFGTGAVWLGCLIALGNMLYRAPLTTQPWFMFLFAAVFVAGMIGVMVMLPEKE
jgi:hypothetical protein